MPRAVKRDSARPREGGRVDISWDTPTIKKEPEGSYFGWVDLKGKTYCIAACQNCRSLALMEKEYFLHWDKDNALFHLNEVLQCCKSPYYLLRNIRVLTND